MAVRDAGTSAVDCLQFQDLERVLNLLLEDYPPQERGYDLIPHPSNSNYFSSLIEEKSNHFLQVSKNITESKRNFLQLCKNVEKNIDDMMEQIILYGNIRQQQLKNQLRDIAGKKIDKWDHQLLVCKDALLQLQKKTVGWPNTSDMFSSSDQYRELECIDAGNLKFEANDLGEILNSFRNLGTIYDNEINIENSLKRIPKFIFGSSGNKPGQFCRPWGVCSDPTGRILVCDRSNQRIQVFNERCEFLFQFGKEGKEPGEFNRPSGIDVDTNCRIIVADKDNHRIQVFSYRGAYLFCFGAQGKKPGEFMYPWDVATNSMCNIAVSDSKNHRVQLFNSGGVILNIFDAHVRFQNPRCALRILDSPRGLAFQPDGTLLVTDFNNHRILILDKCLTKFSTLGCEGKNPGQFFRPQGISCDQSGRFVVSDSKNYRIQVFDSDGTFLKSFGCQGYAPGQFDCPQGISFQQNQNILVVDLNNNRVQIF